ncbi:MAG TPA: low temperature requirement protein A [Actinoplanes sp.]|nr:low temperature requirement protein A [Actinoplanes sp.]
MLTRPLSEGDSVTTLELFFDLVFVFALTQVTAKMADNLTAEGMVRGLLIIALLWWSWTGYAWLGNLVRADEGITRLGMFAAMTAMFVLALCIPEAFDDMPGGLSGPLVMAVCYFVFRALHLVLFYLSAAGDAGLRAQLLRFTPAMLAGTALLLFAGVSDGPLQTWLWVAALAADYLGTYLGGARGWRVASPAHFAERHGLIVIVALGESIIAIGIAVAQLAISWPIVLGSVLGLALSGSLWWAYFNVSAEVGEHALAAAEPERRAGLAQEAYTLLHLPMMAGIVILALGLKKVLQYVGDVEHHHLTDPLKGVGLIALIGGVVLYLLAQSGFQWRTTGRIHPVQVAVALLLVPLGLLGTVMPALATLSLLTATVVAVVTYESIRHAGERRRATGHHHGVVGTE